MPAMGAESSYLLRNYYERASQRPDATRLVTEGDSWFSFPKHWNAADFLEETNRFVTLRLEAPGDELLNIDSGRQKSQLRDYLTDFSRKEIPPHVLLLSAGGNDIIGPDFRGFLQRAEEGSPVEAFIREERAHRKIEQLRLAFLDLADLVSDASPATQVLVHGYDYSIPRDKGTRFFGFQFGPWMWPSLQALEIKDEATQKGIARWFIDAFNTMLEDLSAQTANVHYARLLDLLGPNEWSDEIHPKRDGFRRIASVLRQHIDQLTGIP